MQEIRLKIKRRSGEALFRALLLLSTHKKYTAPNGKLLNHTNLDLPALQLGVTIFAKNIVAMIFDLLALQFLQNIVEMVFNLPALPLSVNIFAKHFGDHLRPTSSTTCSLRHANRLHHGDAVCYIPTYLSTMIVSLSRRTIVTWQACCVQVVSDNKRWQPPSCHLSPWHQSLRQDKKSTKITPR